MCKRMNMETCEVCKCARYFSFSIKNCKNSMIKLYKISFSFSLFLSKSSLFYTFGHATRKKERTKGERDRRRVRFNKTIFSNLNQSSVSVDHDDFIRILFVKTRASDSSFLRPFIFSLPFIFTQIVVILMIVLVRVRNSTLILFF